MSRYEEACRLTERGSGREIIVAVRGTRMGQGAGVRLTCDDNAIELTYQDLNLISTALSDAI